MKIGLFIPCYINAIYPEVGVASYKLLKSLGLDVDYPEDQTCCGQPMANAGFEDEASKMRMAQETQALYNPGILAKKGLKCKSAEKVYDICEFIHDVVKPTSLKAKFPHKVSIHNSCHGVRELGLSRPSELNKPYYNKLRDLLNMVEGIEVFEPEFPDECCGFGGMFAVEEQAVSVCMGQDKIRHHRETGAEYITGADSSCLMHMEGIIKREHLPIKIIHIVEILASEL